jgi:hypothetical protein
MKQEVKYVVELGRRRKHFLPEKKKEWKEQDVKTLCFSLDHETGG